MIALLIALLALSPAYAIQLPLSIPQEKAVYNGTPVAPRGQGWKSTAKLWFGGGGCTGVFIDRDLILTAAHCGNHAELDDLYIDLYFENTHSNQLIVPKAEYELVRHPRYNESGSGGKGANDLALIVLKGEKLPDEFTPTNFVTNSSAVGYGAMAYMVGAGITQTGESSDRLYFTKGPIKNYHAGDVMEVQAVAGQGICGGDSGSPLFVPVGEELMLSSIVVSVYANINKKCGSTVFATVINQARYDWIFETANQIRYGQQN